jgi:CRISPR-associated protein Csd1
MFLKALYDYAMRRRLLDQLPLQRRVIHALIALNSQGELRSDHLLLLTQPDEKGKERPGQERLMPRFPGSNNGGRAYFLAADTIAVLGRDKDTGEPIPADPETAPRTQKNQPKAFLHFWQQVEDAFECTRDGRLGALLAFRRRYYRETEGKVTADLPFLEVRPNKKTGNAEFVGRTGSGTDQYHPLKKATIAFSVDGQPLTLEAENDPLCQYWFATYTKLAFQTEEESESPGTVMNSPPTICLITGNTGQPVARSHKPTILGVPGLASGGYLISFAKESPAFSSYGFAMGANAPVSETAAAAYALALNELLADEGLHNNLGPVAVCFWAKEHDDTARQINHLLNRAYPQQVRGFLRQPFQGKFGREVLNRERIYTIALAANAGRVVVVHWLSQTLEQAAESLRQWQQDLEIAGLYPEATDERIDTGDQTVQGWTAPPLAIPSLARVSLRRSKSQKDDRLIADRIVQLYRSAMEGQPLPVSMLKPILDEFQSALVKDSEKTPMYPFSLSRFALIKLILVRLASQHVETVLPHHASSRKGGDFVPTPTLADTSDSAYNLGRLLAVLEGLQDKYHNYEKKGAGIVERYYGTASSAPAAAFPLLCRLARHHLSKVRKEDEPAARGIEARITEVLSRFEAAAIDQPPSFPRLLTLEQQGRFALGFYQQKAADNQAIRDAKKREAQSQS